MHEQAGGAPGDTPPPVRAGLIGQGRRGRSASTTGGAPCHAATYLSFGWAKPIIEVLPAAEAFRAYRDTQVEIGWPAMRVLYRDAERYLHRHGRAARMTSPAKTATDRGTEHAK